MCEVVLKARSPDGRFAVAIERRPLAFMIATSLSASTMETGGILIGRVSDDGRAVICEATNKPRGSRFTWRSFLRRTEGLAALLKDRWSKNEYYLGEWHSHPGGSAMPSPQDRATMRGIAADRNYDCREPILVIIATRDKAAEVSVHVFPYGEAEIQLKADA